MKYRGQSKAASQLPRREFLAAITVGATAIVGASAAAESGSAPAKSDSEGMQRRTLGKTKEPVTILGLGCAWIAREDSTERQTRQTIETALEGGVRYFDTAPNYPNSESRLGPALAADRDKVFLVTKLEHTDARTAEQDLVQSLRLLRTDHVDLLLMHGLGLPRWDETQTILGKGGVMEFLRQAKSKGLTRFIGASVHPPHLTAQKVLDAVGLELDVVMPWVNYISRIENNAEDQVVAKANQLDLGVVAMKTLGGDGQLADDYDRAFRYALSVPGVHCALVGARNVQQVRRALQAAREFHPFTPQEMQETIALGRRLLESKSKKAAQLRRHVRHDLGVA